MVYLDPKMDIAFKKLFGDIAHKNVIISFLNSILNRTGEKTIVDVVFNDPHNHPETTTSKASIVDVRCTDQAQNNYIVEMQVIRQRDYLERAQYYSAFALSRQLVKGDSYGTLTPVIFVGILNFTLFEGDDDYLSCDQILNVKTYRHRFQHLEFYLVELPKFSKSIDEITTLSDKWIYFLKNAGGMNAIPENLNNPAIKDAFFVLNKSTWTVSSLEQYDRDLDVVRSERGRIDYAMEKGEAQAQRRIAMEMISKNFDVETISQLTKMSVEDVEMLKKGKLPDNKI